MIRTRNQAIARQGAGTNYLATVSDLMAGIVFLFIITLIIFAKQMSERNQEIRQASETRQQFLEQLKYRLVKHNIDVQVILGEGVLRFPSDVRGDLLTTGIRFRIGDEKPTKESIKVIPIIARELSELTPCFTANWTPNCPDKKPNSFVGTILIEGHTDNLPVKLNSQHIRYRNNMELSSLRANSIFLNLRQDKETGEQLMKLTNSNGERILGVSGYGEFRPISEKDSENRRIDLRVLMEIPNRG